jgi:hypothetical protein
MNMPATYMSTIVLPITVNGEIQNVEFTLKDAEARQMIQDLGNALYWIGVTTTELSDGATTNPITVDGESKTAKLGGMASYEGSEFVWNGSAWQEFGKNNFGALAFKSSASGSYTPAGTINAQTASVSGTQTASITPISGVGTLPTFTVSGEQVTFTPGTLPTAGTPVDAVTDVGTVSVDQATFSGTQATITVE